MAHDDPNTSRPDEPTDEPGGSARDEPPGTAAPTARRGFFRRHWLLTAIVALIAVPLLGMTIWAGAALSYSYSSGTRTGYVQKLSRKGWLCKTWEGELAMATAPGVPPQIFVFTIRDDSVAEALTADMGRGRVSLQYDEHRGVPTTCFGETPHFVVSYRLVSDTGPPTFP
jgi:hypothetical protein